MRLLLISDTHGHLEPVDRHAREAGAEAVVHAGDFGFYDDDSPARLESRELFLRVIHSDLPPETKRRAKKLKGDELRAFCRDELPLSQLGSWLREGRGFAQPTFAVWGNHEDGAVVADLLAGRRRVPNLTLLGQAKLGPFRFFGLGGNLLPEHLDEVPIDGGRGKIRATARDVHALLDATPPRAPGEVRILVTHVSPGKQPLVGALAAALDADLTVSGHMGAPYNCVWSDFAIREEDEAEVRLKLGIPSELRLSLPAEPSWYRRFHVNLPDAPGGYAILELRNGKVRLETISEGIRI
jgi:predicted phosphodiesterase